MLVFEIIACSIFHEAVPLALHLPGIYTSLIVCRSLDGNAITSVSYMGVLESLYLLSAPFECIFIDETLQLSVQQSHCVAPSRLLFFDVAHILRVRRINFSDRVDILQGAVMRARVSQMLVPRRVAAVPTVP